MEVDLAGPVKIKSVLVSTLTFTGWLAFFFFIKVDSNTRLIAGEALTRPKLC
jgi:hypothetical protein